MLGDDPTRYDTPEASINCLRTLLQNKAVLLVLDDIWNASDVESFRVEAPYCRTLFTTRNSSIALFLGAKTVKLDTLKPEQAKELLHEWAQRDDPRLGQIAERLGYLPLALKLAGSRLREGLSGEEWLQTFHHVSQIKFGRFATDPTDNLQVCFDLSRDRLPEADRSLYHALGIFPQDTPIPVGVIVRLWKRISSTLSEFDCDELLTEMARLELIERRPDKTVMKHDLLHDYMRGNLGDRSKHTHCELLSAYNPSAEPWWEIPHDGYLYFHLAWHLKEAERLQELRQLLSNFRWLTAKLESADILSLITDYDYLPQDADLRTVQAALLQSAHILAGNHRELPGQLLGRLPEGLSQDIDGLRSQISQDRGFQWLRPLKPSLLDAYLVRTLQRHTGPITAVAITPDGRYAVSCSEDDTLRVWDLDSGQTIRTLQGHTDSPNAVAVTQDYAVSGSADNTLRVWDLQTGKTTQTLQGHTFWVNAVAVTPDGRHAVSGSDDKTLRVWDLHTGRTIQTLQGHTDSLNAVALTPDGRHLVSASADKTLRVWDLLAGKTIQILQGHTSWVTGVAVTPDGRHVVSGSQDKTLRVWDLLTGQTIQTLQGHTDSLTAVAVTPDDRHAVSGSWDNTLRVWDLLTGQTTNTIQSHTDPVNAVAVTPDGRHVVSGSRDKTLRVWDLRRGQTTKILQGHAKPVYSLAVTPDGRYAVSGSGDNTLRVWDVHGGQTTRTLQGHSFPVNAVAVTPHGRHVVSGSADKTLRVWDLLTGQSIQILQGHTDSVNAVAVTPDGHQAVSGSADKTLRVWDLLTGQSIQILQGHTDSVNAVAVTLDGRQAVSGSADKTLRVWNLLTGQTIQILQGHTSWVTAVAVTLDGRQAVSGSADKTLRVWNLLTGQTTNTIQNHTDPINAVALTPHSRHVVSGSCDKTLRVWDLRNEKELVTFTVDGNVTACTVAQDNCTIVAGDGFGRVHFLQFVEADDTKPHSTKTETPELLRHEQSTNKSMKPTVPPPTRDQVFISYSHKDREWLELLQTHLKPYLRDGSIISWSDKQISPGSQWFSEINSALAQTKVAVLLVTPDFLASDFIHEHELGPLLKQAEQGGVRILWVPVRASSYKKTALKDYQGVLDAVKPLAAMTEAERDSALVSICEQIEKAVKAPNP